MAGLAPTAKQVAALAAVMDQDYDSLGEAAKAVLAKAWELYADRARFVVACQVNPPDPAGATRGDWENARVAFGPFATKAPAMAAGNSLGGYLASIDPRLQSRWYVVPISPNSPAQWAKGRAADLDRKAEASDHSGGPSRERRQERITEYFRANPGSQYSGLPEHLAGGYFGDLTPFWEWEKDNANTCPRCSGSGEI